MAPDELIRQLSYTSYMDFNEVAEAVHSGLALGMTTDDMAQFGDRLLDAVQGAALGLTVKQLLGWRDRLPVLLLVVRRCGVRPSDVPETPPVISGA